MITAGMVISFPPYEQKDAPRYGQVLLVTTLFLRVKVLRQKRVIDLYNWQACERDGVIMPCAVRSWPVATKTIVIKITYFQPPTWWQQLRTWWLHGQFQHRVYRSTHSGESKQHYWEARYKIRGLLCVDGHLIPLRHQASRDQIYFLQYDLLTKNKELWKSILQTKPLTKDWEVKSMS